MIRKMRVMKRKRGQSQYLPWAVCITWNNGDCQWTYYRSWNDAMRYVLLRCTAMHLRAGRRALSNADL